jgi:Tfp pilus assembly protein PilO
MAPTEKTGKSEWPELATKVLLALLTLVVIPTFGWVWMAESRISTLERITETVSAEMASSRVNSTNIQLIQKDIEHINEKLDQITELLSERRPR